MRNCPQILTRSAVFDEGERVCEQTRQILPDEARRLGSLQRKLVRTSRYDGRRLGSSIVRPLRGGSEVVLTNQVNPRHVERRAAAAASRLGAGESCLCGDRGRQRLEHLGSGSSSAQHAQRGGSASSARGSQGHATCSVSDGAPAEYEGTRRDTSQPKRARVNSAAHLPRSRRRSRISPLPRQ